MDKGKLDVVGLLYKVGQDLVEQKRCHMRSGFMFGEYLDELQAIMKKENRTGTLQENFDYILERTKQMFFARAEGLGLSNEEAKRRWGEIKNVTTLVITGENDFSEIGDDREMLFSDGS